MRSGTIRHRSIILPLIAVFLSFPACSEKGVGSPSEPLAEGQLQIDPSAFAVAEGDSIRVQVKVIGSDPADPSRVTWSTTDPATGTVRNSHFVAYRSGRTQVKALYRTSSAVADARVELRARSVAGVSARSQAGQVGEPLAGPLRVKVLSYSGLPVSGVKVRWSVTAGGGTTSGKSTVTDENGEAEVTWTLGPETGSQTVTGSVSDAGSVAFEATASAGPAVSLSIDPSAATLEPGDSAILEASASDAFGNPISRAPEWTSADPGVAEIDADGVVRAVATASTKIHALLDSATAEADVHVVPAVAEETVSEIVASPESHTFTAPDQALQLAVSALAESGDPVEGPTFTFESTDPGVVTVDSTGTMIAGAIGTAAVIVGAVTYAVTDTVQVEVVPGAAATAFEDSFESGDFSHTTNGFSWAGGVNSSINSDPAFVRTGAHSMRLRHRAKPDGEDNVTQQDFVLPDVREIWVEYWMHTPNNYHHRDSDGPDNNKFFQLWDVKRSDTDIHMIAELGKNAEVPGASKPWFGIGNDDGVKTSKFGPEGHPVALSGDAPGWHRHRFHVKIGTPDGYINGWEGDGVVQYWLDDALQFDRSNLPLNNTLDASNTFFRNGRFWGWQNSGYDEETVFFIDDVKFHTTDPGW